MIKKLFLWIITVAGLVILFGVCSLVVESRLALKWPRTKGHMISSLLSIDHLPKYTDITRYTNSNSDPTRFYGTDVHYQYTVDGGLYDSNRLSFQVWGTRSPRTALKIMNKYRRQHDVIVYFNPSDPQQAVLEPWNIGDIVIPLMVGGLLAFVGLFSFYEQSLDIKPIQTDNHLSWGNNYQKKGKYEEALNEFNKFIAISPYLAQGYKSRGHLNFEFGKWDEAITDYNQAISIDPTDALIRFNRANAYLGKKEYDKAWEGMQKVMEMGFNVKPEILEEIKKGLPEKPS